MSSNPRYSDWPADARTLAEKAEERHGGWPRFQVLRSVQIRVEELGGPLPFMKGIGRTHPRMGSVEVFPHKDCAALADYPVPGQRGIFDGTGVRIVENPAEQALVRQSEGHRATFVGLRKYRRWDELDALYFFGYAMRTYITMPFLLARLGFVALSTVRDLGQTLHGITVDFPSSYESHCPRQTFFFDDTGLLRRHDYCAEIVGSWANGAHYSDDYIEAGGLQFATRRWVVARLGTLPTPVPVLHARFGSITVT